VVISMKLDKILVSSILGFAEGGVYGIISFIANTIALPYSSIIGITFPLLSEKIKEEKWE